MFGQLYPNLELAQAKSSLKYRVASFQGTRSSDRPSSPDAASASPPSRRQHRVPALSYTQTDMAVAFFDEGSPIPDRTSSIGKRRRQGPTASPTRDESYRFNRSSSLTDDPTRATTSSKDYRDQLVVATATATTTTPPPRLSPTQIQKLQAIDNIIARADSREPTSKDATSTSPPRGRLGPLVLELEGTSGGKIDQGSCVDTVAITPTRRKLSYLMKQDMTNRRDSAKRADTSASPPRERVSSVSNLHQLSTRYLITSTPDTASRTTSQPALAPVSVKHESQRALNDARAMEFVDTVNNKPRSVSMVAANGSTTISLDKQLRRISLVSFEQADGSHEANRRILMRNNSSLAMRRKQMFGIYSIREVMAVIRLFWFLDVDRSDGITLDELFLHREFFTQLGRTDLAAVFHELDVDGNGSITLSELLRVCFRHANDHQLQAMLTLAKVGDLHAYLTGRNAIHSLPLDKANSDAQEERRKELHEIFDVFDRNGDGHINRDELFEALAIDRDMFAPALETSRATWAENARRLERAQAGGLTREDIERFYHEVDTNSDGVLDFDEFVQLMVVAANCLYCMVL